MTAIRVLLDIDGVVADLVGDLCSLAVKSFAPNDFHSYDFAETLPPEALRAAYALMRSDGFVAQISEYEGAARFIADLKARAEVVAVTAPFPSAPRWAFERTGWLQRRGLTHVVHTHEKHLVIGDWMVEDDPRNAGAWLKTHPEGRAIIMDRPWNRDAFESARAGLVHAHMLGRVTRCTSYAQVLSTIFGVSK